MTIPCQWCGKGLRIRIETDGMGGTVEAFRALCDCEDARWRRGECLDCGTPTGPRRGANYRKRCPKHDARAKKRQKAERDRRYKKRHRKARLAYDRAYRRRRRKRPALQAKDNRRRREAYGAERRIRGRRYRRQLPTHIKQLRDRLAYRLSDDEGWSHRAIAEVLGLNSKYVWRLVSEQREFREQATERRAA